MSVVDTIRTFSAGLYIITSCHSNCQSMLNNAEVKSLKK